MSDIDVLNKAKQKTKELIESGELELAKELVEKYKDLLKDDAEIYSMRAVIAMMAGKTEEAENILLEGCKIDKYNFDLLYNLGYLYENNDRYNEALNCYEKAKLYCNDIEANRDLEDKLGNLINCYCKDDKAEGNGAKDMQKKVAFFVKRGMDAFLGDIINNLSKDYNVKQILISKNEDLKLIDIWMEWADICWFEWCDELVEYGSKHILANCKVIICRIHSYEMFTDYPMKVNWSNIDRLIFVAKHIRDFFIDKIKIDEQKTHIIPNGINIDNYRFKVRYKGFNIAYVGYINYKKGPMLLLHTFKAIYDKDNRYKLYIAGKFQDERYLLYFKQMIKELELEKNVFFDGWQDDLDLWLEDKDFILCTSILESQNISVMQAMCKGIQPIIHNFVGAKNIYPDKYVWNTIEEAINYIFYNEYRSFEYRSFIKENYSLEKQTVEIKSLILKSDKCEANNNELEKELELYLKKIEDKDYCNGRLIYHHEVSDAVVSIVTPVYNAKGYLEELFKSISEQTIAYKIEWIIIDDKSSDGSLNIACDLAEKYLGLIGSIKIYSLYKNYGATSALKFGFNKCSSKYAAWISADDLYVSNDKIEFDLQLLMEGAHIVFSNRLLIGENMDNYIARDINKKVLKELTGINPIRKLAFLTYSNPINGSSLVFNRDMYLECGGFDELLINVDGDWDLISKVIMSKFNIAFDDKCVFYRVHEHQTSNNSIKMLLGTSITRLRILSVLKDLNLLSEFIRYVIELNLLNKDNLAQRPIFSYHLLMDYDRDCKLGFGGFLKNIEDAYGYYLLNKIKHISNQLIGSNSFSKFLSYLEKV